MRTASGFLFLVLATVLAVALAAELAAATTLNVPAQYPIIQDAMDAAQAGDTVLVAAGTYMHLRRPPGQDSLCAVFMKSGVTLRGAGRGLTIIDPDSLGRGIHCRNVTSARIERLTVKRAFGQVFGAGILCQFSSPAIRDVEVTRCGDGGIICLDSSPTITASFITNNIAKQGGGISIETNSSPQVADCTITGNSAPAGGGVFIRAFSAPTMTRCLIQDNLLNTVLADGGGIGLVNATLTITDSQIEDNVATGRGGGIAVNDNSTLNATRCDIQGNSTTDNDGWGGGGICIDSSSMTIDRCLIGRNSAPGASSDGGGILALFANQIIIRGTTIAANGTNAAAGRGGGISCFTSSPTIESSIIAFNSPGRGLACTDGTSQPVVSCSDLFGNQGGNQICGTNGGDNFSLDPLFCSLATNDFTLRRNSPCLDNQHPSGAPCGQIGARHLGTCEGIGIAEEEAAPRDPLLRHHAAPNPFGTETAIEFELGRSGHLVLAIYDVDGRRVRLLADGTMAAGKHALAWNGRDDQGRAAASGVYYYRLAGRGWAGQTGRVVLAR